MIRGQPYRYAADEFFLEITPDVASSPPSTIPYTPLKFLRSYRPRGVPRPVLSPQRGLTPCCLLVGGFGHCGVAYSQALLPQKHLYEPCLRCDKSQRGSGRNRTRAKGQSFCDPPSEFNFLPKDTMRVLCPLPPCAEQRQNRWIHIIKLLNECLSAYVL